MGWSGFAEGPAQAARDHLLAHGAARVTTVAHPLVAEGPHRHEVVVHQVGRDPQRRSIPAPVRPPYTYPIDLLVPPWYGTADLWLGFTGLCTVRGLAARALGRVEQVVSWNVDFVPERFGASPVTRVYDAVDRWCCRRADARFELSRVAAEERTRRHGLDVVSMAPTHIVPMGAWLSRIPTTGTDGDAARTIVYMGHLVERQGVATFIEALALLRRRGGNLRGAIIGGGPLLDELRARAASHAELAPKGDDHPLTFHGFVADHREVERLLAGSSVAVAPYVEDVDSFTRFADPGKLKAYAAAGLPIVMTSVPPNSAEMGERGVAELVPGNPEGLATGIEWVLASHDEWSRRRRAALDWAAGFDWDRLLSEAFSHVGFRS